MVFEVISAIVLGMLAIYGLFELIKTIENKLTSSFEVKKSLLIIPLTSTDEDVEFTMKSSLNKLLKSHIAKRNALLGVCYDLNDEKKAIAINVSKNCSNLFFAEREEFERGMKLDDF